MSAQVAKVSQSAVWATADKYLRNVVDPEDYGEYILPFLILRRLECLLAGSKNEVIALAESGKYSIVRRTWRRGRISSLRQRLVLPRPYLERCICWPGYRTHADTSVPDTDQRQN